jgi:hypothetical protein
MGGAFRPDLERLTPAIMREDEATVDANVWEPPRKSKGRLEGRPLDRLGGPRGQRLEN